MANTNSLNSGSLEDLQPGDTLFVQLIETSKKKNYQLEYAEIVQRNGQGSKSLLAAMNEGDDRFTSGKPRRGWMTCTLKGFCKMFDLNPKEVVSKANKVKTHKGKTGYELNILNPVFSDKGKTKVYEGERARMEITETVNPTDWQLENYETAAKQINGEFITHKGQAVFTSMDLVPESFVEHTFLENDRTISNQNEPIVVASFGKKGKKTKKNKSKSPFGDLDS